MPTAFAPLSIVSVLKIMGGRIKLLEVWFQGILPNILSVTVGHRFWSDLKILLSKNSKFKLQSPFVIFVKLHMDKFFEQDYNIEFSKHLIYMDIKMVFLDNLAMLFW